MVFRNATNILKSCSPLDSYKLLAASGLITRAKYRKFWNLLLWPFVRDGQLNFQYFCHGKVLGASVRLSDLSSDMLSVWELSVSDTYHIDGHFIPDLIVDGGGNIGLFTLRMAAAMSSDHRSDVNFVIVEPLPRNIAQIKKHLQMNKIDAEIKPTCLGGSERVIPFYCREAIRSSFDPEEPYSSVVELPVLRLQDVIGTSHAKRILIKLDIEGMELETLSSYIPSEHRPVYIVGELHDYEGQGPLMMELFKNYGWSLELYEIANNYAHFSACSPEALPTLPTLKHSTTSTLRAA